jgi:hypothetical protein
MTERTSSSILLNSSKHAQAPQQASPLKNFAIASTLSYSEQLNTMHCLAAAFAKSFVVSVFPVPAGPSGAPPKLSYRAPINVQ